jgi:hypothetical protein
VDVNPLGPVHLVLGQSRGSGDDEFQGGICTVTDGGDVDDVDWCCWVVPNVAPEVHDFSGAGFEGIGPGMVDEDFGGK